MEGGHKNWDVSQILRQTHPVPQVETWWMVFRLRSGLLINTMDPWAGLSTLWLRQFWPE
jgi:hypothetical protein